MLLHANVHSLLKIATKINSGNSQEIFVMGHPVDVSEKWIYMKLLDCRNVYKSIIDIY